MLRERALGCCERCGRCGANNAHHRINRSQGGSDTLSNLLLLCGSGTTGCHGWVTEHPEEAQRLGYTVSGHHLSKTGPAIPADKPVFRYSRELDRPTWVLLDDDGGITPDMLADQISKMIKDY